MLQRPPIIEVFRATDSVRGGQVTARGEQHGKLQRKRWLNYIRRSRRVPLKFPGSEIIKSESGWRLGGEQNCWNHCDLTGPDATEKMEKRPDVR